MTKRRFYISEIAKGETSLPPEEARHAISALRLSVGEEVEVFDGKGNLAAAKITNIGKRKVDLTINEIKHTKTPEKKLIIATAIPKGKRYQMLVEKCTELGADVLQPVKFERSVSADKSAKADRWALEACKQCKRLWLPEIREAIKFSDLRETYPEATIFLADPQGEMLDAKSGSKDSLLLVGPEGGLTDEEILACESFKDAHKFKLSKNILRTETAAVAACALFAAMKE